MNLLSTKQRKFAYFGAIILLLIPIIVLGRPAGQAGESGGKLAQLRTENDLGEPNLGDVDPTGATMNLVLLGLRGLATDLLWIDYQKHQEMKNWAQVRSTVDSIILLQPHFIKVWDHNGWNLAYNVSSEWDAVEDRYFWVKEGIKFLKKGTARNRKVAELYSKTGKLIGQKIGVADEKTFYIKFFRVDPDTERFNNGPDTDVNPLEKDHYLAARDVYLEANEKEEAYGQQAMNRVIFRQYPAHSLLSHAGELQRGGEFGEVTRAAWNEAFSEWTGQFGQEEFLTRSGKIRLEMDDEAQEAAAREQQVKLDDLRNVVESFQHLVNYKYWRTLALSESESLTQEAHRDIFEGQRLFKDSVLGDAKKQLEIGMNKYVQVLAKYPTLASEDEPIDEILNALLYWRKCMQLLQQPIPLQYPLQFVWEKQQARVGELERRFKIENGVQ